MLGRLIDVAIGAAPSERRTATPPSPAAAAPDFQGVDFLVGGIWRATQDGIVYEETVARTLNGWFLTSTATSTSSTGQTVTTGMLGVDSSNRFLLMWGFRSDGGVVELRQVKAPRNAPPPPPGTKSWTLEGAAMGQRVRQTLIQTGPDQMQALTERFVQGKWQALPSLSYQRTP